MLAEGQVLRKELEALAAAPLVEPYAGPALLTGRATAVFFHEVFGHRAEGFRQKDISEGQTFARKVGEQILPNFLSIYDDPTEKTTGKACSIGALYATLDRLEAKGLIETWMGDATAQRGGRPKRMVRVTAQGRKAATAFYGAVMRASRGVSWETNREGVAS